MTTYIDFIDELDIDDNYQVSGRYALINKIT